MRDGMRRPLMLLALLVSLILIGATGIRLIDGRPWLESIYLALITLMTVGSRDVPQGENASTLMAFMILYLVGGIGLFTYGVSSLAQVFSGDDFRRMWERRRMDRTIQNLSGHYIVCGAGRMGSAICEYLAERNRKFVVLDHSIQVLESVCRPRQWPYLLGDATDDEVLKRAGIERARALATVLETDADNVYVVLTARMLSSTVQIVARATEDGAVTKLQRAGATRVISPFSSGAVKMARFMLSPGVEDFFEITDARGAELQLAEVQITDKSPLVGKCLAETDLREKGVMVIGIRRVAGDYLLPPPGTARIESGDILFAFGKTGAVNDMIGDQGFALDPGGRRDDGLR